MQRWMNQGTTMRYNDVRTDIECCGRYGFEAVELKYNLVRSQEPRRIKELLQGNHVRAGSMGAVQLPVLQGKETASLMEERLHAICRYAGILEAGCVVAVPPRGAAGADWGGIREEAAEILGRYSDIAAGYRLKIALEITGFADSLLNTIGKGLEIINRVKKKNLGLIYDFYHVLGMEDLGREILTAEAENIFIVHVNDGLRCTAGEYEDDDRLWPGDGDADIAGQINMLKAVGYEGPFSMEVYQPQMWPYDIHRCYSIARDRMKIIEDCITK